MFPHTRGADAGVATSVVAASVSWLTTANEVVQLIAGLVAIVSGLAALWFYVKSNMRMKKQPKDYDDGD
jgi:intracellular septation protein A